MQALAPALVGATWPRRAAAAVLDFLAGNDHFFLNLSMAALQGDARRRARRARTRPGDGDGAQRRRVRHPRERPRATAGSPRRPPVPDGLYFPGYGPADANPDLGDSAITETAGLGGFAMAAAPAIVQFVGGTPERRRGYHALRCTTITLARNAAFTAARPRLRGTPPGIDVRRVVETGILPVINTGIAHREPGIGQIGAGIAHAAAAAASAPRCRPWPPAGRRPAKVRDESDDRADRDRRATRSIRESQPGTIAEPVRAAA